MPIAPKRFFDFCASHVPLLHAIATKPGDVSEAQVRQLIRTHCDTATEQPETTWQRLLELQILVPLEEGSSHYVLAQPLLQLMNYLHDDALPTSPEIIQGYTAALESARKRIASGTQAFDTLSVGLAATEVDHTLRRMQEDLDATHRAVMAEVARYKADRSSVSVRERYLRIVRLMDLYVQPLVDIVRVDGQLVDTLNELDAALSAAREAGVFAELAPLLRNERQIRALRRRAIHTLNESRKELQPLYEVLRRSSAIAHGATLALGRLRHMKLDDWVAHYVPQAERASIECPPTDAVLKRTIHHVAAHPPQPPPSLRMEESAETPPDYVRLLWLKALPDALAAELPVKDLTDWMVRTYPDKGTSDALLGLSRILFDPELTVTFKHGKPKAYRTRDGVIEATTFSISKP
ncbi:MAG: hypothetical protein QY325_15785 [Flavobacteriales bacterium]|jgi:hypothetical protein|nr:MAG: hypothetical protein QY325_15785 [Flavobacteriales bacterium]